MEKIKLLSQIELYQQELQESESNFKIFFESIDHMFIVSDLGGNIIHCNQSLIQRLGYSLEELTKMNSIQLHPKEKHKEIYEVVDKLIKKEIDYYPLDVKAKSGEIYSFETKIWRGKWNGQDCLFSTSKDITKETQQALELERFFSINLDLLCIADMEGNFIKTNKAWEDILGYTSPELEKRTFLEFIHPEDMEKTLKAIEELKHGKKVIKFINRYIASDGKYHYIEWKSNGYGDKIYAAARDITERIEYEERILEISNKDALTNIYNRRYVFERAKEIVEQYKRTGQIFSVCIMDLDHFKKINDEYGHQVGDEVLKEFTKVVNHILRPQDIFGRYGGEEFIVILSKTNAEDGVAVIERVLNIVRSKVFDCGGYNIKFTFSAGISNCLEVEKDKLVLDDLIKLADQRMYVAKNMGRNKIIS